MTEKQVGWRIERSAFRRLPGKKNRRFRVNNVRLLVEERDRRPSGASAHSLRIVSGCRSDAVTDPVVTPQLGPGVSLRVFTVQEGEGS